MEVYLKSIKNKISKLTEVNDTESFDDPQMKKLIAAALCFNQGVREDSDEKYSKTKQIYKLLTKDSLKTLRSIFLDSITDKKIGMTRKQFTEAVGLVLDESFDEKQIEELFYKVDVKDKGMVTWEEYSDYLLLEMNQREKLIQIEDQLLGNNIQIFKTEGRDSIKCILIIPFGDESGDGKTATLVKDDCRYFTCSRDGVMNFWSSNFQSSDVINLQSFLSKGLNLSSWVTTAEVMSDQKIIVIATTSFSLYVFRYSSSNEFELCSRIEKFPGTIVCLSYYKDELPTNASFLTWGDEHGGVGVIAFHTPISKTSLGSNSKPDINKKVYNTTFHFTDLSNNHVIGIEARYLSDIHQRNVCQVRYISKLHSWITCSKDTCDALFIGDLVPKIPHKNRIYYSVMQGVAVFEYSEKLNFIITGGADCIIRLWNPLSKGQKLMSVFRGHVSPISHLMVDQRDICLISVSVSKDIRIFDMANQGCIQKIKKSAFKMMGKKPFTVSCINKRNHTVILASDMRLALIEGKEDSLARNSLSTLPYVITDVLYNPLFKHIVTGDCKSQVIAWDAASGDKVVQYSAHTVVQKGRRLEVEIKVMAFDSTYRQLITGHRDGMVKVWNYNVGVLLQELPVPGRFEVSALCCSPMKIFVAGCNKSIFMHISDTEMKSYVTLKPSHPDSITTLSVLEDTFLSSASLDGTLMIYNLKSNLPLLKFNLSNLNHKASVDFYGHVAMESYFPEFHNSERSKIRKRTVKITNLSSNKPRTTIGVSNENLHYKYCVETMVFLKSRPITPDTAVLLTGMHDGRVIAWPLSIEGRCLGEFMAVYKEAELLHAMAVTSDDLFLVTGDSLGYIRVWDIHHFYNPNVGQCSEDIDAQRRLIWSKFSFVMMRQNINAYISRWDMSRLPSHMKLKCDRQAGFPLEHPHLVNHFKGHVADIVGIRLINTLNNNLIVSMASDMSVRIWTLEGCIMGILGQKTVWNNLDSSCGFFNINIIQNEIRKVDKRIEDCGHSTFHMTKDEVKVISYKESTEDLTAKPIKFEKKVKTSESRTSVEKMCQYMDNVEHDDAYLNSINMVSVKDNYLDSNYGVSQSESSNSMVYQATIRTRLKTDVARVLLKLWEKHKKRTLVKYKVHSDIKRVGSFTTLYVLESELGIKAQSKWAKIKHASVWIVNYLQPTKDKLFTKFHLPNADPSKVGVYSNNIKDMIEEYLTNRATNNITSLYENKSVSQTKTTTDKKNILQRPLSPLTSDIFGQFYNEPYTKHHLIKPLSMSDAIAKKGLFAYKKLPLANFSTDNPAARVVALFQEAGVQAGLDFKTTASMMRNTGKGAFVATTESEMTLVKHLNKTGWKLMSDGTLARRKVPLNSQKTHSYLPPLLVPENSVQDGVKKKGENCFVGKAKPRTTY